MDRYYYETENSHYRLRDRQNGQQTVALIFHVTEADIITKAMNDAVAEGNLGRGDMNSAIKTLVDRGVNLRQADATDFD